MRLIYCSQTGRISDELMSAGGGSALTTDKMWRIYSSFALLSLIQTYHGVASGCSIVTLTSPSASTLYVEWLGDPKASVYLLNLGVVNSTSIAPVVLMQTASTTKRVVQGLRPGTVYTVTLQAFQYLSTPLCTITNLTLTVPATPQFTSSKAISSTSVVFVWSNVTGADSYILFVQETFSSSPKIYNQTFTSVSGQMDGLTPSTTYTCYVYSSNRAGRGAKSNTLTVLTLVQPPTGVTIMATGKNAALVTWNPVYKVLVYQVVVTDNHKSNQAPVIQTTSATSLNLTNLKPCSTITVGVSSINAFLDPGEPSNVSYTTSTINGVTTVSTSYSCSQSMVMATWDQVPEASLYRATAVDSTGASLNCTTSSTSCQITGVSCGEKYQVRVAVISNECESTSNATSTFDTITCAPALPVTQHDCSSNVIIFSWQPTNNTLFYVATAVDSTNAVTECRTEDNSCYFTDTTCGQLYIFQVYAVSYGCNSQKSKPKYVHTSPCLPTNIWTAAECNSNTLTTTWDSSAGALSYSVTAQGNNGEAYNCSSSGNNCTINGVPCGEQLSVWIVASNNHCSTDMVLGNVAQTVPCTPTSVAASADCSQDSATVHWEMSYGSLLYFAVITDATGNSHQCFSLGTSCLINSLKCGTNYTTKVYGTNLMCNSTVSQAVTFTTGPCSPANVVASRDCDLNSAVILWQNQQLSGLYTAILEDQSSNKLNCTSNTVNSCEIPSVPCGKKYNATVTYRDGNCVSTSKAVSMDSVPCGPKNVRASVTCGTDYLTVTWSTLVPADNYITIISTGMGQPLYCNSTENKCTMGGLLCESSYTVTVFSITGMCLSLPSSEVTVITLPCPPTNVTTIHTCAPDPVPVLWTSSGNANSYIVEAVDSIGHRVECTTNNTSCSLPGLQCGEFYTISVVGANDNCTGQQSNTYSLKTAPCTPSNLTSQVMCAEGAARVFWTPSTNAVSYNVKATGHGAPLTCSSSTSNCTLSPLVCGQAYDIQVTASDGTCASNYSRTFRQDQVPCAPENVTTALLCGTNDLTVSWISSSLPLNYSVITKQLDGNTHLACQTSNASCVLSSLQCGQTFSVSVKASSDCCSGPYSLSQTIQTVPCTPQSLTAVRDCGMNSLVASWDASPGASTYTATVTGPNGFSKSCSSPNLTCSFSNLQCSTTYNIQVTAQGALCTSAPIQTTVTTEPCDPMNVTSVLQCGSNTATVSWVESAGAVSYTVLAQEGDSSQYTSCRSNATSCQLNQLQCGRVYNLTVLAEDDTCNSTGANRGVLMTAPCSLSIQSSDLICGNSSALLSWTPVVHATGYIVKATTSDGHSVSCSSPSGSCTLVDLLCSEMYEATVTARGNQCDSATGPSISIITTPCSPVLISKGYNCGTNSAGVSWSAPLGSIKFLSQVVGDGYQDSCNTANTTCVFKTLPCGLNFNVSVQAQGAKCSSSISVSESLQTVPCPPVNVSATILCSNHSALVTWVGSATASGYNVTATSQAGHTHRCHTSSTSCQVPDLHCGETYSIAVTPYSQTCTGTQSAAYSFRAGLCAPRNITLSPVCEDNTISWSPVPGAEMFIATATGVDGHTYTCSSNGSNMCNFTDLSCGEVYSVTVVTVDRGCWSSPSSSVQLKTALCPPANLTGLVSCETNTLTLTWSPVAGASYFLQWEMIGSTSSPSEYQTSNSSLSLSNLMCGETYTFIIAAQVTDCTSHYSLPSQISTGPCQPTNFTAQVDCGTNNGTFSWGNSSRAGFYVVQAIGNDGHVASCTSSDTSCAVKLHCGRIYSASLVASTDSCNSTKYTDIYFHSAPCLIDNVVAEVDCDANSMMVNWTPSSSSDEYTAWAMSTDGHRVSCNSTSNHCSIQNLMCGKIYEVAVTSSSINCEIVAGSDYKVQSAPCRPENTTVELNCSSNILTVKWDDSSTTQNFTVIATSTSGVNSTCDSVKSSCSFLDLSCDQLYTFTVTGHTNVCISHMSSPKETLTAPCTPSSVSAELNCSTHNALISWSGAASAEATAYSVQAVSNAGYNTSCSTMGTSCYLGNLVCGQEYSVAVEAINSGCPGPASTPAMLTTGPCVPENVSVHYNVSAAWVSWRVARGASSYFVQAVANQNPPLTCLTNDTSCFLSGFQCSQIYNVTVTARNQACDHMTHELSHFMSAPCPPSNVQATFSCEQLTAAVSWQQSGLAVGYAAYFDDRNGHSTSCVGTRSDTSCVVSDLMCGTVYDVWVKALGLKYNSSDSSVVSLTSEPCQPSSIQSSLDCEARSASVTWQPGAGAWSYVTVLTSTSGHTTSCTTNLTSCQFSSLQCGELYTITVTSQGQMCNSTAQMAGFLTTAPCLPSHVDVRVSCESADALVSWSPAQGATNVSVSAVIGGSLQTLCTAQHSSCNVTGLSCSESYDLSLTSSDEQCSVTAATHTSLHTHPCPPQHVAVSLQCGSSTADLSWEEKSDVELYTASAIKASGGQATNCNSTGSSCQFSGLDCGEMFNFTVRAYSQGCWSQISSTVFIQSDPCQPVIVSAQALCQSEEVQISWQQAAGVLNYLVTATGNPEHMETFNTNQTLLSATLPCGQLYNITVQGQGSECNSIPSLPFFVKTGPCTPSNVATSVQCEHNTGSISWSPSDGAESYIAVATSHDNHTHRCFTNTTSCTWNDLHCGEAYVVVVRAKTENCTSLPSSSSIIYMDPCTPQNLSASVSCDTQAVSLSWKGSSGATLYMASAETGDKSVSLSTNITTAIFSELICGQNYSLSVTPRNEHCSGSSSASISVPTWPCTPSGISARQDCISGIAVVTWQASNGSDYYTAAMETDSGLLQACMSETTGCSVTDLACGHNFSVSVTASNQQCSVTSTQTARLQSVPCVPSNVSVVMNCANNSAAVSWSPSPGAVWYSVISNSSHVNESCQASDLSCLACGSSYTVQVVAKDNSCSSIPSQPVVFNSGPCPPQNLSAHISCSNNLMVSWDAFRDSDFFLVSLTPDNGGTSKICNTTNTNCSTSSVTCGSSFTVQVSSVRGACQNEDIQTQSIQSAPCQPQAVRGSLNCVTNSALISWDAAPGANSYFVSAVGGRNHSANCTTSTNTTCEVEDLACGVLYNFTVTAINSNCQSSPSASISLQTAPCSLSGITAFTQCYNSSILVVWDVVQGGEGNTVYTVTAEASDRTVLTCNGTDTSCFLHGTRCDLRYTIIVSASSDQCSGLRSPPYRICMEPCPPRDVMVNASCEDHGALVSWTPSPVAKTYHVVAMAADGHAQTCNTTSSNCSLSQLLCDQQYSVFVTAGHENCSSRASQNATLTTGPCPPGGLSIVYHCDTLVAVLSWTPSKNVKEYYSSAQAGNGDMLYCSNSTSTCTIEGLECGAVYNVSVQASDGTCNSSLSAPVQTGGAPCPPVAVMMELMPMENEIQVLHFSWTQNTCGGTEYLLSLTGNLLGDDQEQFVLSSYWTNITYFEIPLPCSSYYVATLQSRNAAGNSNITVPLNGTTAPCPPSGGTFIGNSSFATISWTPSVFANMYTVYDNSVTPKVQLCSTTMLSCSLHNITSSSLLLTASNAAGDSQPENVTLVEILQRRRRELRENLQVDGASLTEVTQAAPTVFFLQWSQVENATFYSLLVRKQGSINDNQSFTVYGETIILTDLSPNSAYCFSVLAVRNATSGPESEPVCVQTGQSLAAKH